MVFENCFSFLSVFSLSPLSSTSPCHSSCNLSNHLLVSSVLISLPLVYFNGSFLLVPFSASVIFFLSSSPQPKQIHPLIKQVGVRASNVRWHQMSEGGLDSMNVEWSGVVLSWSCVWWVSSCPSDHLYRHCRCFLRASRTPCWHSRLSLACLPLYSTHLNSSLQQASKHSLIH